MNRLRRKKRLGVRRQAERDAAFAWPKTTASQTKAPSSLRSPGALQEAGAISGSWPRFASSRSSLPYP